MADRDTFEAALDELADAGEFERLAEMRLVYADWLEEQGDASAGAQRWLAGAGKSPRRTDGGTWDWWRYGDRADSKPEDLPAAVWARLPGVPLRDVPDCKEYPTRESAERALYKALMLLELLPA